MINFPMAALARSVSQRLVAVLHIQFLMFCIAVTSGCTATADAVNTNTVLRYGDLAVVGNRIVDQHKKPVSLAGVSLFWGNKGWGGEKFYHGGSIAYLKNEWNAELVRVAMGVDANGGLIHDWDARIAKVKTMVDAAIAQGLYVIIDWHSHHAEDYPQAAQLFFTQMASQYGRYPNVIYEIYNEPLEQTDWNKTVKPYAENIIATIRAIDPDNIIVVGTQKWAQEVDKAADNPITGFANIAYSLHFYAGSHKQELRDRAQYALDKGIALMVTEWGSVNADGDGPVAQAETLRWMKFIRENQLSHCNWSLNNKKEGASIFKPKTDPLGPWSESDLTPSGVFVKEIIKNW